MGRFSNSTARAVISTATVNPTAKKKGKAAAFINFWLPKPDSTKAKLGSVSLTTSNSNISRFVEWLKADEASAIAVLKDKLILEFRSNDADSKAEFALDSRFDSTPVPANTTAPDDSEGFIEADAFINLYLPNNKGKQTKLGFLPLRSSDGAHTDLIGWLANEKHQASRLERLKQAMLIDFKLNGGTVVKINYDWMKDEDAEAEATDADAEDPPFDM